MAPLNLRQVTSTLPLNHHPAFTTEPLHPPDSPLSKRLEKTQTTFVSLKAPPFSATVKVASPVER